MHILAGLLGAVLIALSVLHLRWAFGGRAEGPAIPSRADGTPLFRPGPLASLSVAGALALAAAIVLARGQLMPADAQSAAVRLGTWGVAIAFAARTVGEFRYVGLFRRVRGTPFARWDAWVFTPLCAVIAAASAWLAASP